MNYKSVLLAIAATACCTLSLSVNAQTPSAAPAPQAGPVFTDFGATYRVDGDVMPAKDAVMKIRFDIKEAANAGTLNRQINSAARFINMNVAAGVPEKNIHIALIVHGAAGSDLLKDEIYRAQNGGKPNGSANAVQQLLRHGVEIYLCGQSAMGRGVAKADLIPGVKMALSAMDMHSQLGQQGYILIP